MGTIARRPDWRHGRRPGCSTSGGARLSVSRHGRHGRFRRHLALFELQQAAALQTALGFAEFFQRLQNILRGQRPFVEKPLCVFASERAECTGVLFGLDAFCDDFLAEFVGQRDDGSQDGRNGAGFAAAMNQGAVDLDSVEGEYVEVGER